MGTGKIYNKGAFDIKPTSFHSMLNRYVKINNAIFYVRRLNEFGEASLCKTTDAGGGGIRENIGMIWPAGIKTKYFTLKFLHHGIPCEQRIKYSEVLISSN